MLILLSAADSFFQLIFVLIIFIGVLALTYYVTKWIAGYQKTQGLNKNLEIVEAIRITNNKYVQIVRAGEDKYFVIAIGKEEVTLLGELMGFNKFRIIGLDFSTNNHNINVTGNTFLEPSQLLGQQIIFL